MFPREPNATDKAAERCQTDPEPGVDSGRATVRNVRSKCRCSCVLQFTFRRAVSCVLHRPPSQVIHCTVSCFGNFAERVCTTEKFDERVHLHTGWVTKLWRRRRANVLAAATIPRPPCCQSRRASPIEPRKPNRQHGVAAAGRRARGPRIRSSKGSCGGEQL